MEPRLGAIVPGTRWLSTKAGAPISRLASKGAAMDLPTALPFVRTPRCRRAGSLPRMSLRPAVQPRRLPGVRHPVASCRDRPVQSVWRLPKEGPGLRPLPLCILVSSRNPCPDSRIQVPGRPHGRAATGPADGRLDRAPGRSEARAARAGSTPRRAHSRARIQSGDRNCADRRTPDADSGSRPRSGAIPSYTAAGRSSAGAKAAQSSWSILGRDPARDQARGARRRCGHHRRNDFRACTGLKARGSGDGRGLGDCKNGCEIRLSSGSSSAAGNRGELQVVQREGNEDEHSQCIVVEERPEACRRLSVSDPPLLMNRE